MNELSRNIFNYGNKKLCAESKYLDEDYIHEGDKLLYDQLNHEEKEKLQSWPIYNLL